MLPDDWITTSAIRTPTGPGLLVRVEGGMRDASGDPVSRVEVRVAPMGGGSGPSGYVAMRTVERGGRAPLESSAGPFGTLEEAGREAALWIRGLVTADGHRPGEPRDEPGGPRRP